MKKGKEREAPERQEEIRLTDSTMSLIANWYEQDFLEFFDKKEKLYSSWNWVLRDYIKVYIWTEHKDFPEEVLKKIPNRNLSTLTKFYLGLIPELHALDYYVNPDLLKQIKIDCEPYVSKAYDMLSSMMSEKTSLGKTNMVAFLANIFQARFWNLQQTFTYQKPYNKLRSNNLADLSTEIVQIWGFKMTAQKLKDYLDTIKLFAKQIRPTQTMRFKNVSVIDGRLVDNNSQLARSYDDTDFVVVSGLEIPTIIPKKTLDFVRNYTHFNPAVHTVSQESRPFLEMEMAWFYYSTMSRYTVGKMRANIGMAFLYEYQKTGGSRGKSTVLEALQNIINSSYDTVNTLDTPAGALEASRINDRQNRIEIASNMLTILEEKDGERYTLEFEAFLKSKNNAGLKDTAKYATQFSSTTQLGSIATTTNFQPQFTSSGDFLRDRFYGMVFTQQFGKRGDQNITELLQDEEFLGGLVRWAFDRIDSEETFDMMVEHFKQQYDITMSVGNIELETAYQFFNTHNQKAWSDKWHFMKKSGTKKGAIQKTKRVITRDDAREIYALLAGATKKTVVGIQYISDEPQYKNVARFTKYLENVIANDKRLRDIIDFTSRVEINGDTSQKIVITDTEKLAEIMGFDERKTEIEKAWLAKHNEQTNSVGEKVETLSQAENEEQAPVGIKASASSKFQEAWLASLKKQYEELETQEQKDVFIERTAQAIMVMSTMSGTEPDYEIHTLEAVNNEEIPKGIIDKIFNGSVFDTEVGVLQISAKDEYIYRLRLIT